MENEQNEVVESTQNEVVEQDDNVTSGSEAIDSTGSQDIAREMALHVAKEFAQLIWNLANNLEIVKRSLSNDTFKHLSKDCRKEMIEAMTNESSDIFDMSKAFTKKLKAVKRVQIDQAVLDQMILFGE